MQKPSPKDVKKIQDIFKDFIKFKINKLQIARWN